MNSPAMDRFETILNFAIENDNKIDAKAEILKAADKLLEDAAMEMAEASINSIAILLLTIYKTGHYPGNSPNKVIDELALVLADAGQKNADRPAYDSY